MNSQEDARARALTRLFLPGAFWIVRMGIGSATTPTALAVAAAVDAVLVGLHLWAASPLKQDRTESVTSHFGAFNNLFGVPTALAAVLCALDAWRLASR